MRPHLFMNQRSAHVGRDWVESAGTNNVNPFGLGLLVVLQLNLLQELRLSRDVNVMSATGKAGLDNLEILELGYELLLIFGLMGSAKNKCNHVRASEWGQKDEQILQKRKIYPWKSIKD